MPLKSATQNAGQKQRKVVLAVVAQAKLLDVAGPLQVFTDARHEDGSRAYNVVLASENGGPISTDSGAKKGQASYFLSHKGELKIHAIMLWHRECPNAIEMDTSRRYKATRRLNCLSIA
jgi:transcriptional regulator GlxA family with amidase domain